MVPYKLIPGAFSSASSVSTIAVGVYFLTALGDVVYICFYSKTEIYKKYNS